MVKFYVKKIICDTVDIDDEYKKDIRVFLIYLSTIERWNFNCF